MTREEAIELLEDLDGAIEDNHGRDYDEAFRMAIESLSAEPSDIVFRGGKIPPKEMLGGTVLIPKHQWIEMERELAELKSKFESAEAEWIPCSERLPRFGEQVLCCDSQARVFTSALTEIASNGMAFFGKHCKVIAWMPLPKPYREDGEEE